ncbi:uncharacterized protein [Maniola hyperantus]|uniref:uncharacterized protein n=1 Tax=Aphantopus hyperantus TaxID=2795564 RepID=UPI0037489D1D
MFPIAEKIFNKVDDPGKGHGFVSSTNSPQELADKLFEAFFSTTKRIIFLKDEDLPGLDALQALALSGESRLERMKPKRSKYQLVTKIMTEGKQGATRKPNRSKFKHIALRQFINRIILYILL